MAKSKSKKNTSGSTKCHWCSYLKPYYPWATEEAIHASHSPQRQQIANEETRSNFNPQIRSPEGRKVIRNPIDVLDPTAECPVELLGMDEKSVYLWAEFLRDEHEEKGEYLAPSGLLTYAFSLRVLSYPERTQVANTLRRIYAEELRRQRERDEEWECRVTMRAENISGDSDAPSVDSAAGVETLKTRAPRKVGVIACIIDVLKSASKKHPISKEVILDRLCREFPDRERKAMASTVSSQVPTGLLKEKGIKLRHTEDKSGWWIPKEAKP